MKFLSDDHLELESNEDFRSQIHNWIKTAKLCNIDSWHDLLDELPGVFPAEVLAALRRESRQSPKQKEYFDRIFRQACKTPVNQLSGSRKFPQYVHLEHPLDYEWHFTDSAKSKLIAAAIQAPYNNEGDVLCIGCPSVFTYGNAKQSKKNFHLWDKNIEAAGQIQEASLLSKIDLAKDGLCSIRVSAAILDPPWYDEYYRLFLWAASKALTPNGKVVLSFPPHGTRASAVDDSNKFLSWAKKRGFALHSIEENCLPYRTPLFEVNALKASGIHTFPRNWRKGNMIILEKVRDEPFKRPLIDSRFTQWTECKAENTRIKILSTFRNGESLLKPVYRTAVIPSVSSRYSYRNLANVVTSGNRFLYTSRPDILTLLLSGEENKRSKHGDAEEKHKLQMQLQRLLRQERNETLYYLNTYQ